VQVVGMVLVLGGVVAGQTRGSGERAKQKISEEPRRVSAPSVEVCGAA
jgi:hypothetical protein